MNTRICYSSSHNPLQNELSLALSTAISVDISVAFVTKYGFDFLRNNLDFNHQKLRFVTSVRYPTDLDELSKFSNLNPHQTWIHLGGLTPQENNGDRYQLHSKIFWFEDSQRNVTIHIGSHNLTAAALCGVNIEAGVCISCVNSDQTAHDVTKHIDNSINESELFDPNKLDFYKAVQAILQGGQPPSQVLGEFERDDCLVILAEADDPNLMGYQELQLFFSPLGKKVAFALRLGRKVSLYLYRRGTLFNNHARYVYPIHFNGDITMVNDKNDAAVIERKIDSLIRSMKSPIVEPAKKIPDNISGAFQVVALLINQGEMEIPAYHSGNSSPKVKSRLEYLERTDLLQNPYLPEAIEEYFTMESIRGDSLITKVPSRIESCVTLNIPNYDKPEIYQQDPLKRLQEMDAKRVEKLGQKLSYYSQTRRNKAAWETEYFYQVSYSRKWKNSNQ